MNYYHHVQHCKPWKCMVYICFLYFVLSFWPFSPLKLSFVLCHFAGNVSLVAQWVLLGACLLVSLWTGCCCSPPLLIPNSLSFHDPALTWFSHFSDHPLCRLCKKQFRKGWCSPGLSSGHTDLLCAFPWASSTFMVSALTCLLILVWTAWILESDRLKLQFYLATSLLWPWINYLTSLYCKLLSL